MNFQTDIIVDSNNSLQATAIQAPTTDGGSTYGAGSAGQSLRTNGTSVYWGTDVLMFTNDTAWSTIYEVLNSLPIYRTYVAAFGGDQMSIVSGGTRTVYCTGTLQRRATTTFVFSGRTSDNRMIAWGLAGISESSPGTYTENFFAFRDNSAETALAASDTLIPTVRTVRYSYYNDVDQTGSGYALDARVGKTINDKVTAIEDKFVTVGNVNSSTTKYITASASARFILFANSTTAQRNDMLICTVNSGGTAITAVHLGAFTDLTVTTTTVANRYQIKSANTNTAACTILVLYGTVTLV